jgi:gamma-D-glutamyl-L-lysine dipeptidyl-peptidase
MEYGFCNLNIVPVRSGPSDKTEMVSQLLFGEIFEILDKDGKWIQIKMTYDNYVGWIDMKQYLPIYADVYEKLNDFPPNITLDIVQILVNETENSVMPIVIGSSIPYLVNNMFYVDKVEYKYDGHISEKNVPDPKKKIVENSYMYLESPYLWGGRSPFGIDCSGFTQMAYKLSGIKLWRDAEQQSEQGTTINLISEAEPGDLVFFDNEEGKIVHTGILLEDEKIIHASGKVRIDKLDHEGIFNQSLNRYTHKLRIIKKII